MSPLLSCRCRSAAAESPPLRHTVAQAARSSALGLGFILSWAVLHTFPALLLLLLCFTDCVPRVLAGASCKGKPVTSHLLLASRAGRGSVTLILAIRECQLLCNSCQVSSTPSQQPWRAWFKLKNPIREALLICSYLS